MKVSIDENDRWISLEFTPENPEDAAILLRLTMQTKNERPCLNTYFGDRLNTDIAFKKNKSPHKPYGITNRKKVIIK